MTEFKLDRDNEYKLENQEELRFEVENDEKIIIELVDGYAEIFGTELVKGTKYTFFAGAKAAIFSYHGCTINVSSYFKPSENLSSCFSSFYTSKETPMNFYLNSHGYLEKLRNKYPKEDRPGPIVLLCGPVDVGKSTLCKILLNYAVNCKRTPIYVDLDVGQGNIGIPGVIGCNIIEKPCDIETGNFSDLAPLCLHYGDKSLDSNINLFKILVSELANLIEKKQDEDQLVKESGVIINTGGWIINQGYQLLLHIAEVFKVDIIFAIDQEKLYNALKRDQPNCVKVLLVPKSGGVVTKSPEHRRESRDKRIREYFYGLRLKDSNTQLYPHLFDLPFNSFKIYQIGAPEVPNSCLPLGMKKEDHLTQLVKIDPSIAIQNHILSLTHTADLNEVIRTNIKGFVCVTNVDTERQIITIISPQPKDKLPPNPIFLLSRIQYLDSH